MVPISPLCVHWQGEDECPAPDCYRRLPIAAADEAWALGKYSTPKRQSTDSGYAYFGELVNQLKYSVSSSQRYWTDQIDTLSSQFSRFIEKRLHRNFDICLVVPGNRPNTDSVMGKVALSLSTTGQVTEVQQLGRRSQTRVMKEVEPQKRANEISGAYSFETASELSSNLSILIVDDVFDTGATLNEAARTVRHAAPSAYIAAVCATYLRDPKELT